MILFQPCFVVKDTAPNDNMICDEFHKGTFVIPWKRTTRPVVLTSAEESSKSPVPLLTILRHSHLILSLAISGFEIHAEKTQENLIVFIYSRCWQKISLPHQFGANTRGTMVFIQHKVCIQATSNMVLECQLATITWDKQDLSTCFKMNESGRATASTIISFDTCQL